MAFCSALWVESPCHKDSVNLHQDQCKMLIHMCFKRQGASTPLVAAQNRSLEINKIIYLCILRLELRQKSQALQLRFCPSPPLRVEDGTRNSGRSKLWPIPSTRGSRVVAADHSFEMQKKHEIKKEHDFGIPNLALVAPNCNSMHFVRKHLLAAAAFVCRKLMLDDQFSHILYIFIIDIYVYIYTLPCFGVLGYTMVYHGPLPYDQFSHL